MIVLYTIVALAALVLGSIVWILYREITLATPLGGSFDRPVCQGGSCKYSCVVPIGYVKNSTGATELVSNSFSGGCDLPMQMLGSTFDGGMRAWSTGDTLEAKLQEDALFSIDRLDAIANGITMITWGTDRQDGLGLGGKTTVEQCTGYGPIKPKGAPNDLRVGWETGVIYMSNKGADTDDVLSYVPYPFIHIFRIVLGDDGMPSKLYMWEALIDDQSKSLEYTEQLKNNIGAENLFGEGGEFASLTTTQEYVPVAEANNVMMIEMSFDPSRGIDVPIPSQWCDKVLAYNLLGTNIPK